jgi:3-keto-L-gulonate-6-phosphate decarboxylase
MRTLHLVTDGRLMHTIHLEAGHTQNVIQANKNAIERLRSEAAGPSEIIICDAKNMEIGNIDIPHVKSEQAIHDKVAMFTFIVVITIGYLLVS